MLNKLQYFAVSLLWLLMSQAAQALDGTSFITKWQTLADGDTIQIPIHPDYAYNTNIDCDNDGVFEKTGITDQANMTCTYATAGEHIISISGDFPAFYLYIVSPARSWEGCPSTAKNPCNQLLEVMQWGSIQWQTMEGAFYDARHLQITALDNPILDDVTDMSRMFASTPNFNADITAWDVSNITNMGGMFTGSYEFNQDISSWDVSNVTNMASMFWLATDFNQDISSWDVSNVTNMTHMFDGTRAFNQDISVWNVSNVTNMSGMFQYAEVFDQAINAWDVSNVTNMANMFFSASIFNQDLNNWNVSQVQNMEDMFYEATRFNGNVTTWDVSNVTNMSGIFYHAIYFNQNITEWNVSNVTNMRSMFAYTSFNQDISNWDVSNVTNMVGMFAGTPFDQDISAWDVSNVTRMDSMFQDTTVFNQDISHWDVSNVTIISGMFQNAPAFNQDLSRWNVSQVQYMDHLFRGATRFNGNVTTWDVSQVVSMTAMFKDATVFNQDISGWNVSNVTNMMGMFYRAKKFNQDLNNWDVSKVREMQAMFMEATAFNGNISTWDVSNVTQMQGMFAEATSFNGNISAWNVSNVSQMDFLFLGASAFNQDISAWDVGNVTSMSSMFYNAKAFNQNISTWNVSNVKDMSNMFARAINFNQNISTWDVSNVTNMRAMFQGAISFNQDLRNWNISQVASMNNMFSGISLSVANYDALLQAWSQLPLTANVVFNAGMTKYSAGSVAETARATLINTYGWTINDGDSTAIPVDITECGQVANGRSNITISSPCHNDDWLFNVHVTETGSITGGVLSGKIDNQGLIQDVEITNGELEGGTLAGYILTTDFLQTPLDASDLIPRDRYVGTRNVIKNVTFTAGSVLETADGHLQMIPGFMGALGNYILRGSIIGDPLTPVVFKQVVLGGVAYVSHAIMEDYSSISIDSPTLYGQGVMPYNEAYICDETIVSNFAPELAPNVCLGYVILHADADNELTDPIVFGQGVRYDGHQYIPSQSNQEGECDAPVSSLLRGTEPNACFVQADTILRIMPAPEHVGQTVDVVFLAVDDTYTYSYDGKFWQGNSLGVENIISAKTIAALPYTLDVTLPNLDLFNEVFAGYRLGDGDIIYRRVK